MINLQTPLRIYGSVGLLFLIFFFLTLNHWRFGWGAAGALQEGDLSWPRTTGGHRVDEFEGGPGL